MIISVVAISMRRSRISWCIPEQTFPLHVPGIVAGTASKFICGINPEIAVDRMSYDSPFGGLQDEK